MSVILSHLLKLEAYDQQSEMLSILVPPSGYAIICLPDGTYIPVCLRTSNFFE